MSSFRFRRSTSRLTYFLSPGRLEGSQVRLSKTRHFDAYLLSVYSVFGSPTGPPCMQSCRLHVPFLLFYFAMHPLYPKRAISRCDALIRRHHRVVLSLPRVTLLIYHLSFTIEAISASLFGTQDRRLRRVHLR